MGSNWLCTFDRMHNFIIIMRYNPLDDICPAAHIYLDLTVLKNSILKLSKDFLNGIIY